MIKISKQNNSLIVEGIDNVFYPNNGDNSYPLNSLIVVTDNSDMATFRSVATNDVLFSGLINNITINGEAVTKDNIIEKFDTVSNSSTGGGGGGTVDAYTKEEADNKFSTKDELTAVETVANNADTKADAATSRVESVETSLGNKQDILVSGTNIKTINSQSILGEGNLEISGGEVDLTNYYTKTEADGKFATVTGLNEQAANISALETAMNGKQATLVSGENIKTINSESILGTGDIQISSEAKIYDAEEIKITFKQELINCMNHLNTGEDYTKQLYINSDDRAIYDNFFHNIKYGDIVLIGKTSQKYRLVYRGVNQGYYRFAVIIYKYDNLKNFTADISLYYTQISDYLTFATNNGGPAAKITDIPNTDNFATKDELTAVETSLGNKQDILVSGTNIKTINGNSILGEGNLVIEGGGIDLSNYYTKTETDTKLGTKQNNLVSGTNIKTINSQSILGEGNIEVTIPDATTATSGAMSAADKTKLDSMLNEWTGTQQEYDALTTKDNNTIYYVTE